MGVDVVLAPDLLLGQEVPVLVVEDDMDLLGAGTADVGAKHDVVGGLAVPGLVEGAVDELDVAGAAIDVLLVHDGELDDEGLLAAGGQGLVELGADGGAIHDVVGRLAVPVGLVEGAVDELDVASAAINVLLVLDGELDDKGLLVAGGQGLGADGGAEHDVVGGLAVHVCLVEGAVEELDVSAAAINVLLVLDGELDDEGLLGAGGQGLVELDADGVEAGVLGGLVLAEADHDVAG